MYFRLCNDKVRIPHPGRLERHCCTFRRFICSWHKVKQIDQQICILFQFPRIKRRMDWGDIIVLIIRIMKIDHLRHQLLQIQLHAVHDIYIIRHPASLIMHIAKCPVRFPVKIRYRSYKNCTPRVPACRKPDRLHRVPHARFIRKEEQEVLYFLFSC